MQYNADHVSVCGSVITFTRDGVVVALVPGA